MGDSRGDECRKESRSPARLEVAHRGGGPCVRRAQLDRPPRARLTLTPPPPPSLPADVASARIFLFHRHCPSQQLLAVRSALVLRRSVRRRHLRRGVFISFMPLRLAPSTAQTHLLHGAAIHAQARAVGKDRGARGEVEHRGCVSVGRASVEVFQSRRAPRVESAASLVWPTRAARRNRSTVSALELSMSRRRVPCALGGRHVGRVEAGLERVAADAALGQHRREHGAKVRRRCFGHVAVGQQWRQNRECGESRGRTREH